MCISAFIKGAPHRADPAVHHIRRGHYVNPGLCMGQGLFCQELQCPVIVNRSVFEYTAVTVARVLAETYICYYKQVIYLFLQRSHSFLNYPVIGISFGPDLILFLRDPEKYNTGDAQVPYRKALLYKLVHGHLVVTRH